MGRQDLDTDNEQKDIVIDALTGDFIARDSDKAHIDYIVNTSVGQWKQSPLLGVGIFTFLNAGVIHLILSQVSKWSYYQ